MMTQAKIKKYAENCVKTENSCCTVNLSCCFKADLSHCSEWYDWYFN